MTSTGHHSAATSRGPKTLSLLAAFTLSLAALAGAGAPPASALVSTGYVFTTIADPQATDGTVVTGINDSGTVVGFYQRGFTGHGFVESGGVYTTVDYPGALGTAVNGINNSGDLVGTYVDSSGNQHGFIDIGGSFTSVDDPLAANPNGTSANGINDSAVVTGTYFDSAGTSHAFVYSGGTYTTIDDPLGTVGNAAFGINSSGSVVGIYFPDPVTPGGPSQGNGFLKTGSTFTTIDDPLGAGGSFALGINAAGDIAGYFIDSSALIHGFVESGGSFTTIDDPVALQSTRVTGINSSNDIVGTYLDNTLLFRGFMASIGTVVPGAASHFVVSAPTQVRAGDAFTFTVTAEDGNGNVVTDYRGVVHLSSSDGQAILQSDRQITNGVGTFTAALKTTGHQTITANDRRLPIVAGQSEVINVVTRGTSHFVLTAPPAVTHGVPFQFSIQAVDAYGNVVPGYAGVVHFSSSDATASLPADTRFSNGVATFSATLNATGPQTITANDVRLPVITGSTGSIQSM